MQSFIPLHPDMFHTLSLGSQYEVTRTYNVQTNIKELEQEPIYETHTDTFSATLTQVLPNHSVPQMYMKDNTDCHITLAGAWEQYQIRLM